MPCKHLLWQTGMNEMLQRLPFGQFVAACILIPVTIFFVAYVLDSGRCFVLLSIQKTKVSEYLEKQADRLLAEKSEL